ncbi:hypothetical protein ABD86_12745 [Paenibacillus alvei]|nr:hypothetical protein PAV_1c02970 [Paenibacillus alvei DSM 29]MBG9734895.1 hypothetical protein [Paenibacillus alvei]MBG9744770.1 hypothetical protein [Paenibacillus alvei]
MKAWFPLLQYKIESLFFKEDLLAKLAKITYTLVFDRRVKIVLNLNKDSIEIGMGCKCYQLRADCVCFCVPKHRGNNIE